jgi:hypothetical protein
MFKLSIYYEGSSMYALVCILKVYIFASVPRFDTRPRHQTAQSPKPFRMLKLTSWSFLRVWLLTRKSCASCVCDCVCDCVCVVDPEVLRIRLRKGLLNHSSIWPL